MVAVGTLTEENLVQLGTQPHREHKLSNVSAKSIDKAIKKLGGEAMNAAQTSECTGLRAGEYCRGASR